MLFVMTRSRMSRTFLQRNARAMDRDPTRRHQSASELQDDLNAVKDEMLAAARAAQRRLPEAPWEQPTTPFQRRPPLPRRGPRSPASAG